MDPMRAVPAFFRPSSSGIVVSAVRLAIVLCLLVCAACSPDSRDRPPGYIRLAPAWELVQPETVIDRSAFLVRYDKDGFSVMSTLSSYDLSRLQRRTTPEGWRWYSLTDDSVFADDGTVLHGPAAEPLPYYELALDRGGVSSVGADTLYVRVGKKKPSTWRFTVPTELLTKPAAQTR